MRLAKPTGLRKILTLVIVIAALGAGTYFIYNHFWGSSSKNKKGPDVAISNSKLSDIQSDAAQNNLANQNYTQARYNYISAATSATANNDYSKAKQILLEGEQKLPQDALTWDYYDTLAAVAEQLNDTSLEKDSLQKALTKATEPHSGCPKSIVAAYKDKLSKL